MNSTSYISYAGVEATIAKTDTAAGRYRLDS
jgi:hypothetical protein